MPEKATDQSLDGCMFIGTGVEFKGDVSVPARASVNGKFEGVLRAKDLIVGQSGRVSGQIAVETAEILGVVDDKLTVQSKLILRATGSISGSLSYSKIMVEEGGNLAGTIEKIVAQPATAIASQSGTAEAIKPKIIQMQRAGE